MLDTYIRATSGTARYLLFLLMDFFGPVIRTFCRLASIGGLFAFLFLLVAQSKHPFAETAMYSILAMSLSAMALLLYYEIALDRMYIDRLYPDIEDHEEVRDMSWWAPIINWLIVLALLVACCAAANSLYGLKPYHIKGIAIGAIAWIALGIALGVARWLYRLTGGAPAAVADVARKVVGSVVTLAKKKASVHEAVRPEGKVVQFRKR